MLNLYTIDILFFVYSNFRRMKRIFNDQTSHTLAFHATFNPFPPRVPIWHGLAKLSILILIGISKKISYARRDYKLLDEKSPS